MEIKILKPVILDVEGKQKVYSPSQKIISIADGLAKEKNYVERYQKYPQHIEIISLPSVDKEEVKEEVPEVEEKPKAKKAKKTKE
ncbi:hypothetical protein [Jeotgalibaca porci]|uniref:hypothetical protein n=1 Tax=Jeotgalibaca porci TaxID=1868793 RepID=UPI00359F31B0